MDTKPAGSATLGPRELIIYGLNLLVLIKGASCAALICGDLDFKFRLQGPSAPCARETLFCISTHLKESGLNMC